jgi:hypothetical protein
LGLRGTASILAYSLPVLLIAALTFLMS